MKTRFKLENFLLDNQTTLIHGAHECEMFADLPKYFSVPLAEMKAPGMILFKSESKFTVYASYTHSKPSEEELKATNVRSKVLKLAHIKRGGYLSFDHEYVYLKLIGASDFNIKIQVQFTFP